ncbi:MAG: glycoside hydrolase family 127 protein [Clostridia bacterium]|nr:glycoside hydrolase family 127 protein [Clostridia bacterium]
MKSVFKPYTTKEIIPEGWLRDQLEIQAKGLAGNLDKMWPDVRDSKWIGGDKEGWERVPYWLDGFVPLAYLLNDEDMIARAKKYIDAILAGQKNDGWICPCEDSQRATYDMWALFLILKVLILYYDCSGDERVEEAVCRALKNYYHFSAGHLATNWATSRWYECVISIAWLYSRRPTQWLISLAKALEAQGMDYTRAFDIMKEKSIDWRHYTHVVNLAMAIKSDAVMSLIDDRNPNTYADKLTAFLDKYHGNVNGYFNGDECLAGRSPSQGTELCGVAEAMYSYEVLSCISGEVKWADRLERLTYNAYPATVSEDMWTHQYNQMSNQPYCVNYGTKPHFTTNTSDSHIFGLEPNYGCCTANMGQAFPKFAIHSYMKADDGIAVVTLAPASLVTEINGVKVKITKETLYPFRDSVKIKVNADKPVKFKLYVRIPGFADSAKVNGEKVKTGEYFICEKEFSDDVISLELENIAKFVKRDSLYAVVRGALTYTLPVKERWEKREYTKNGVERVYPYCDYEIYPESEWRYGYASDELEYVEYDDYKSAFATDKPLCAIRTKVRRVEWDFIPGVEYVPNGTPKSRVGIGEAVDIELVPFATAKLRMTELPKVK